MLYWLGIKKMRMMDTRVSTLLGLPLIEIMLVSCHFELHNGPAYRSSR
jgi:hypothetical protein